MKNVWIERAELVQMPASLNEDREPELHPIKRSEVPRLKDYWRWHHGQGVITTQELLTLLAMIEFLSRDTI